MKKRGATAKSLTTKYQRHGECKGCGWKCCTMLTFYTPRGIDVDGFYAWVKRTGFILVHPTDPEDYMRWLRVHNVQCSADAEGDVSVQLNKVQLLSMQTFKWTDISGLSFSITCKHLTGDGKCAVYNKPVRPKICGDFPSHPAELLPLRVNPTAEPTDEECAYWFTKE